MGGDLQMSKIVRCECGFIVRGENENEVIEKVEAHVREQHPDLAGKISRDDIYGMIEEG